MAGDTNRPPSRPRSRSLLLLALAGCGLLSGCLPVDGISSKARDVHNLFFIIVALALPVLVFFEGWLLFSVFRYRKRGDQEPPQLFGDSRVRMLGLFAVPLAIVAILFPFGEATLSKVQASEPSPGIDINAEGFQWEWTFNYVHEGVTSSGITLVKPAVMELPVDEPVHIHLTSRDVMHEFFVPDLLFMRNALPGHPNDFSFTPDKLGTYNAQCAEFCGLNHDRMTFVVKVVTLQEFAQWVAAEKAKALNVSCGLSGNGSSFTAVAHNVQWNSHCFAVRAGAPFKVTVQNRDAGIDHNFSVYDSRALKVNYLKTTKFAGVATRDFDGKALPAGRYYFECDVHGPSMSGVLIVK